MEDKHRTILRDNRPNIVKDLEPNNILPDLGSVLTPKDDADIKAQSKRQERCEQLLEIIPRKGPNAFKVFVEALKKEFPHLADDLIEADELKTKLEAEKQGHTKTSQELEELKNLHATFKTETSQQIQKLAEIVQQLTEFLQSFKEEHVELSQKLKVANEKHQREDLREKNNESNEVVLKLENKFEKIQRDLEEIKNDLANQSERAKDYQQKLEVESKAADDSLKLRLKNTEQQVCKANKIHRKKLGSEERLKCYTLQKEVHRLRLPQIYSYDLATNHDKPDLDTGRRDEQGRLPEISSHTRVCARELLPCEFEVVVMSRTLFKEFYRGVENSPSWMLLRKPRQRKVNLCKLEPLRRTYRGIVGHGIA